MCEVRGITQQVILHGGIADVIGVGVSRSLTQLFNKVTIYSCKHGIYLMGLGFGDMHACASVVTAQGCVAMDVRACFRQNQVVGRVGEAASKCAGAHNLTEQNGAAEGEYKQWRNLTLRLRRQC